jgi:F-type H+-transporting ATPase subunit epsilon
MPEAGVAGQLKCLVITPEKQLVDQEADFVILTAVDGEMGILPEHSAVLCKLEPGLLRIDTKDKKQSFFVDGGFAEVVDNRVTILTPFAVPAENLDSQLITEELAAAEKLPVASETRAVRLKSARVKMAIRASLKSSEEHRA